MRRRWLLLSLAALAAGAFAVAAHRGDEPARPRAVVVITLDTTRADAVGPGRATPGINRFLAEATHFTSVRAPVPLTLPAHLTLFSGLDPRSHGVHGNVVPRLGKDRGYPLLAEQFRDAGYDTAAFVASAVLGRSTGFDEGFDTYDAPAFPTGHRQMPEEADGYVPAPERVNAPLQWLAGRKAPFFLWVHLYDPHAPYHPYEGDEQREPTPPRPSPADLYAGEVRRVDAAVERLLRAIPRDAIVILASDHGESLGGHGEATHGSLCTAEVLDIFLAVRARGLPMGQRGDLRSLADVAPWLRDVCRLPEARHDGWSLAETAPPSRVVVSESLWTYHTHRWAQVFCATNGRFTLMDAGPRLELYDLAKDPTEIRPLDPRGHAEYEPLDRALLAYRGGRQAPELSGAYAEVPPYASAVIPRDSYLPRAENAHLRDPAKGFALAARIAHARVLIARGNRIDDVDALEQAIRILRGVAAKDPANPSPHLYLVHAQGRLGALLKRPDLRHAAAESARAAIERGYTVAPLLRDLLNESLCAGSRHSLRQAVDLACDGGITPDFDCAMLVAISGQELLKHGDREGAARAVDFLGRCGNEPRILEARRQLARRTLAR